MIGIYKITSPSNKVYIGQSVNIERRLYKYQKFKDCKKQFKLLNSFNKYGIENHIFEIIEECDEKELNNRERYYQDLYNVIKNGLNCKLTTSKDKSGFLSQETKDKISKANKGRVYSPKVLENIRNLRKDYKHSEETRLKMSNLKKGTIQSEETRKKISLNSKRSKKVINSETGEIYMSCTELANFLGINRKTLSKKLSGLRPNNTIYKYIDNE